jgi:UDP-N-acetylmuramyl pentapeptide synthase
LTALAAPLGPERKILFARECPQFKVIAITTDADIDRKIERGILAAYRETKITKRSFDFRVQVIGTMQISNGIASILISHIHGHLQPREIQQLR